METINSRVGSHHHFNHYLSRDNANEQKPKIPIKKDEFNVKTESHQNLEDISKKVDHNYEIADVKFDYTVDIASILSYSSTL